MQVAGAYARLLRRNDGSTAEKVKQAYLEEVDFRFEYSEKASQELFGYELPQILLIHCNELNSVTLRDSIARLRQRGYSFTTLEEAMKDPAYQHPDSFAGPGGSWLHRTATYMGKKVTSATQPKFPQWIADLPRQ